MNDGARPIEVLLVDTVGQLLTFYAAADVAFVGGSLVPVGGHNLLEPAALQLPILTGPNNFNSEDIAKLLVEGHVDEAIARRLGMNVRTCRAHIAKLATALGSGSRAQLGYLIAQSGILEQEQIH